MYKDTLMVRLKAHTPLSINSWPEHLTRSQSATTWKCNLVYTGGKSKHHLSTVSSPQLSQSGGEADIHVLTRTCYRVTFKACCLCTEVYIRFIQKAVCIL